MTGSSLFAVAVKAADVSDKMLKGLGITKSKVEDLLSKTKPDSLNKQVAGSISIFPIIMTNDIPINAASHISAMLELEYANLMTIALANSPRVSIKEINNGKYLKKYHTNLSNLESVLCDSFDSEDFIESSMARSIMDATMENVVFSRTIVNRLNKMMEEAMDPKPSIYGLDWLMEGNKDSSRIGTGLSISREVRAWKDHIDKRRDRKEDLRREEERTRDSHISKDFSRTYNYKGINDMQPIPVVANIFTVDDNNTPSRQIEVVSGVKSKIHPINKGEFFSLMSSQEKGGFLAEIIRFTSGEIHFFRDIVFGTPTIKEYASKMSKFHSNGAKVLGVLKRVKDLNRSGANILPNATLVVSKAAVDELKRKTGIDLLDEDEALNVCDELSLIKFIVSDPLGGKLHVIMPGMYDTFSVMSTDTLEKQIDATQDAALTKELRKIISKD